MPADRLCRQRRLNGILERHESLSDDSFATSFLSLVSGKLRVWQQTGLAADLAVSCRIPLVGNALVVQDGSMSAKNRDFEWLFQSVLKQQFKVLVHEIDDLVFVAILDQDTETVAASVWR